MAVMSTALISMPAPVSSQPQAMARTATSPATSTTRSRCSTASSKLAPVPALLGPAELLLVFFVAVQEAVRAPGNVRHRTMPTVQVEPDLPGALGEAGDILGLVKHPAIRQHGDHLMLRIGDRVANRLAMCVHRWWHLDAGAPLVQVPIEGNRREQRILDGLNDDREDLEHGADRLVRARQDIEQCVLLCVAGPLVDDRMHYPMTMMNGARKVEGGDDRKVIELHAVAWPLSILKPTKPVQWP